MLFIGVTSYPHLHFSDEHTLKNRPNAGRLEVTHVLRKPKLLLYFIPIFIPLRAHCAARRFLSSDIEINLS